MVNRQIVLIDESWDWFGGRGKAATHVRRQAAQGLGGEDALTLCGGGRVIW